MRTDSKNPFANNMIVSLKDDKWLGYQRIAGRIASDALIVLEQEVKNRTQLSLIDLNACAEEIITKAGGVPTFKGYGKPPFPAGVCISVNRQLVHGIPTGYKLQDGDLVSFDLGVTIEGAIADTALTCIYGEPRSEQHVKLIKATEESLMRGIKAIGVGKRLGVIGHAIYKYAHGLGFGVINNYGGHGLDWNIPHASPFVANKSNFDEGIRIQENLTLAIEPMLTVNSTKTWIDRDGWTVWCEAEASAHYEHSIYVHKDYVEIITDRNR